MRRIRIFVLDNRVKNAGKRHVEKICEKVFEDCKEGELLKVDNLHVATLLVYK
jgi:hypothetical protein